MLVHHPKNDRTRIIVQIKNSVGEAPQQRATDLPMYNRMLLGQALYPNDDLIDGV